METKKEVNETKMEKRMRNRADKTEKKLLYMEAEADIRQSHMQIIYGMYNFSSVFIIVAKLLKIYIL